MARRRTTDLRRWVLLAGLVCCSSCQSVSSTFENKTGQSESKPRVFSPRMDYDEWTPLGRGDPLKNNPTFDYVPPVLDRVQYWLDSHTTEPSAKRDILVLGVTAKKTSPKIPEQFLKFVDGPKFTRSNQDVSYGNDFTGSTGAEPPKLVRTTNFRNGPPVDYRNQNRIQSVPGSYYPAPYYNQKTKPYTMMVPPPLLQKDKIVSFVEPTQQFSTQTEEGPVLRQESQFYALPPKSYNQHPPPSQSPTKSTQSKSPSKGAMVSQVETIQSVYGPPSGQPATTKSRYESVTTPSVSFEKSNLIYQSTQTLSGGWPGSNGPVSTPTTSNQSTWQTLDYSRDQYEIDHHVAASSSNHEVVVEQNANIIVDGESNENEEVVVGQKEVVPSDKLSPSAAILPRPSSVVNSSFDRGNGNADEDPASGLWSSEKMHIVVANSPGGLADVDARKEQRREPVAVVMPTTYSEKNLSLTSQSSSVVVVAAAAAAAAAAESTGSRLPENFTTIDPKTLLENPRKAEQAQSIGNSVTGSPILRENAPQPSGVLPNRIVSASSANEFHRQHAHSHPTPAAPLSRHPAGSSLHAFAPPQPPLQSMMHPPARPNHGTMHFLGSMRPNIGFRVPASMSMFPPMAHMHAPPMKPIATHMGPPLPVEQQSHRVPQTQDFAGAFTDPPAPSSLTAQPTGPGEQHSFDRHRSRAPDATASFTAPTPFAPTVSSIENEPAVVAVSRYPETVVGTISAGDENEKTSTVSPRVTTVPNLTTDPIFSHYNQPAKPIRGPMYLIIQGHSKVKTYKPTVTKHGAPTEKEEKNEIADGVTERQLSKFEQFVKETTKNASGPSGANRKAAETKKAEEKARAEKLAQARQNSLMSLVESGLGSFTVSPSDSATEEDHQANSVTTIEINGN